MAKKLRVKLNEVDQVFILARKELSVVELSKKLGVAERSIEKFLSTQTQTPVVETPKTNGLDSFAIKRSDRTKEVEVVSMTQGAAEQGDNIASVELDLRNRYSKSVTKIHPDK